MQLDKSVRSMRLPQLTRRRQVDLTCVLLREMETLPGIHKEGTIAAWDSGNPETSSLGALAHETRFPGSTPNVCGGGIAIRSAPSAYTLTADSEEWVIASMRATPSPGEVRSGAVETDCRRWPMPSIWRRSAPRSVWGFLLDLTTDVVSKLNLRDVLREI